MPRASTTSDVFNAIAEPRRRQIINLLARTADKPRTVGEIVITLGLPQPAVSKHLSVLKQVGVLSMSKNGRQRMYKLNAGQLKPVHDWVKVFERFWAHQLDRIKQRAEQKARQQ